MYILITLSLLLLGASVLLVFRFVRPAASYAWMAAALTSLLAWASLFLWQLSLPFRFHFASWGPVNLFASSPELLADPVSWVYALALLSMTVAIVMTTPARSVQVNAVALSGTVGLAAVGLLALLADNPLTIVLVWTAIDLVELFNSLRTANSSGLSQRVVIAFALRGLGTGFALWASVTSVSTGQPLLFESVPAQAGIFLLLAVGLRLGVLPLHLTLPTEPGLRRGLGTTLRLTAAASGLIVLARIPPSILPTGWTSVLLGLVALAALYAGWSWMFAADALNGRPYWIIGMAALSLAAALRGSASGSVAWGISLVLFGSFSFLYSARHVWITRLLAALGLFLLGLPFTFTASGWEGAFPLPVLFWPAFVIAAAFLVIGYVRHLFRQGETQFIDLPQWAKASFPFGLALLAVAVLVSSFGGWPGALHVGVLIPGLILFMLSVGVIAAALRFSVFDQVSRSTAQAIQNSSFLAFQERVAGFASGLYHFLGQLSGYLGALLEGDGGLLWTLLLLVLLVSLLRGR